MKLILVMHVSSCLHIPNYNILFQFKSFGSCSKLVISVTEHLVEVVDKLSTTAVVFFSQYLGIPLTPSKINLSVFSKGLKIKQG